MSLLDYSRWMLAEWERGEARELWERYVESLD